MLISVALKSPAGRTGGNLAGIHCNGGAGVGLISASGPAVIFSGGYSIRHLEEQI